MTTLAAAPSLTSSSAAASGAPATASSGAAAAPARPSLRAQAAIAGVILAAFTVFSLWVLAGHGFTGFLALVGREPWALQLLIDLAVSLTFALSWMRADARRLGIAAWPFIAAAPLVGSIAVLAYMVRRGAVTPRRGT